MPTYEYACKACEHRFEIHQSFTDDALTVCPECGGALRKVFGNIGITFKGSGFYKTDSRSGSSASASSRSDAASNGSTTAADSPAASSTSSGSDSSSLSPSPASPTPAASSPASSSPSKPAK